MEIKLPSPEEKFVVMDEDSDIFHEVVSGIHIQLRGDEKVPGFVWYCVCADKVHDGLFRGKRCLHVAMSLEYALDYIAKYFVPCEEPEEKVEEGSIVEGGNGDGRGASEERRGSADTFEIKQETYALDKVDNDPGTYAFLRHDLTNAFKSFSVILAHLGGVFLD